MFLSYITLAVALSLSVIAAYYSIAGLTTIFAAAVVPIIVMGGILELGKVVVTLWLHEYWRQCRLLMKVYLVPAVAVLMIITSMGIFGFLSKAHSDQTLVSGDVQARIAIYYEKIRTAKENIDANRRALKQMDEAVDQVMGRSTTETGAERSVQIRRSQGPERKRLIAEIEAEQKKISALNEERAPIAAEVRKVEAEVGPIKYIAALVYGDNPDANLLEKAVRWVIILLVVVFDPLAIMMLLAATESMKWERQRIFEALKLAPKTEEEEFEAALAKKREVARALDSGGDLPLEDTVVQEHKQDPHPSGWMFGPVTKTLEPEKSILEQHPYLTAGFPHFKDLKPMVATPPSEQPVAASTDADHNSALIEDEGITEKDAMKLWKQQNPDDTLKHQKKLLAEGEIQVLPWMQLLPDNAIGFGADFPPGAKKGDQWIKTDSIPTRLFKYNGTRWIEIDKQSTDSYTYNMAYIDYLISAISKGQYDPDMLSDAERDQIALRLESKKE